MCHSEFSWGLNCSGSWPVSRLLDWMAACRERKREATACPCACVWGAARSCTYTRVASAPTGAFPRGTDENTHMSLWEMQATLSSESPASVLRRLVGASGFPRSRSQLCACLACQGWGLWAPIPPREERSPRGTHYIPVQGASRVRGRFKGRETEPGTVEVL